LIPLTREDGLTARQEPSTPNDGRLQRCKVLSGQRPRSTKGIG
jgi:hypothetical protein